MLEEGVSLDRLLVLSSITLVFPPAISPFSSYLSVFSSLRVRTQCDFLKRHRL